jgi:hypothetical protein
MPITSNGSCGTGASGASGTTVTVAPTRPCAVGEELTIVVSAREAVN